MCLRYQLNFDLNTSYPAEYPESAFQYPAFSFSRISGIRLSGKFAIRHIPIIGIPSNCVPNAYVYLI